MLKKNSLSPIIDVFNLFFPHCCYGCGTDSLHKNALLCARCIENLPHTDFHLYPNNPTERIFIGRLPVKQAHSEFYFYKSGVVQRLIHQLKYKGNRDAGIFLGKLMGKTLQTSERFGDIDLIVPMPLFKARERKRGYNQALILSEGIASITGIPIGDNVIVRKNATETQTRKQRTARWENVRNSFEVSDPLAIEGKHVLLTDDVLTTGATLEACGMALSEARPSGISIATLAIASK